MQNKFSNLFLLVSDPPYQALLSDYCIKIHAPITGEGIPGENSRMITRSVCTSVTSVFKNSRRKGHF